LEVLVLFGHRLVYPVILEDLVLFGHRLV